MKKIAKSLADLNERSIVKDALNRSQGLDSVVNDVFNLWAPDLSKRKPRLNVKYDNGRPSYVTSLDFLPLLLNFAIRNSFVNISSYNNLRPSIKRTGEKVISKNNRHGYVLQINANKETHAFSVLLMDFNVVQQLSDGFERVGAPRKFNILDDAGSWYDGFNNLEFTASLTSGELALLNFRKVVDVVFDYFVHPSRAMSIYSAGYIMTKLVEERCSDEVRFYKNLAKTLEEDGISLPETKKIPEWKFYFKKNKKTKKFVPKKIRMKKSLVLEKELGEKDVVPVLLTRLEHPEFKDDYKIFGLNSGRKLIEFEWGLPGNKNALQDILRYCKARVNYLTFNVGTQLRACTRAVELAFFKYGTNIGTIQWGDEDTNPGWDIPDWQDTKIKNTNYRMLDFGNGLRLLYRLKVKEPKVKAQELLEEF